MALEVTIGGDGALFVGEDKDLFFEVLDSADLDSPVDISAMTFLFDVRAKDTSSDPAIISKAPQIVGVFNPARASNTQRAKVTLSDDETNLFSAKTYRYSFKRMDAGSERVINYGDFVLQKATAP